MMKTYVYIKDYAPPARIGRRGRVFAAILNKTGRMLDFSCGYGGGKEVFLQVRQLTGPEWQVFFKN